MSPQPAIRTQTDDLDEEYTFLTALDCSDKPDMARQEFKDETDVNKILARYGVDGRQQPPQYSAIDYNMDLQQALDAIREAETAITKLPPSLRAKYSTWERLMDGAYNGEFKTDLATYHEKLAADKAAADKIVLDKANPPI